MRTHVIGIDAGTTSMKGMILDSEGLVVTTAKEEYLLDHGPGDRCELDPDIYWRITCKIIKEMIIASGIEPNSITGVSFSSQGETVIPVDECGKPLRKAIVWMDNRSHQEAEEIKAFFGEQKIMDITGQPEVVATWTATRISWLRKNEPELFHRVYKYLLVEDFLIFQMTGKYCTEHSIVSSSLYFDIRKKQWWGEMLAFLGITDNHLPRLLPSGSIVGKITEEASNATGLGENVACVTGSYDHAAGAIGSGNTKSGDVTLTIGASMAMCVAMDDATSDLSIKLPCHAHSIEGRYFLQPYAQTAGMVLKWFKDSFCQEETRIARDSGADVYDLIVEQAGKVPPGSDGLLMLPHLMGTGSPEFNPSATGVFANIRMGVSREHFIRAILESVCVMVRHNLETMKNHGIELNRIFALGGASKSNRWMQILSDVTGLPVTTLKVNENSVMGACIIAAVATGMFDNYDKACEKSIGRDSSFTPNAENHLLYDRLYRNYTLLYDSMNNFWGKTGANE